MTYLVLLTVIGCIGLSSAQVHFPGGCPALNVVENFNTERVTQPLLLSALHNVNQMIIFSILACGIIKRTIHMFINCLADV
jgi:hypothetical protein